jgi:hypothetical protein
MRELTAVDGEVVSIPDPARLIHLQFRRFAGCPICNLHLRSVVQRHDEIVAAGIREVVVFHSPAAELREYDLPFAVIADPAKKLYAEFGVGSSPRALLNPRAYPAIVRGIGRGLVDIARGRGKGPALRQPAGRLGLPADFLIAPDGHRVASKFGQHAYDQWSVDELMALATSRPEYDQKSGTSKPPFGG